MAKTKKELQADLERYRNELAYVRAAQADLNEEAGDEAFDEDQSQRWDESVEFVESHEALIARTETVLDGIERRGTVGEAGTADFSVNTRDSEDPYDLDDVSLRTSGSEIRGRALTAIEKTPHLPDAAKEAATESIQLLDNTRGQMSLHILATGSETYREAWQRALSGAPLTDKHWDALEFARAALAIGADATGGYAIPFTLDPTVIDIGDHEESPIRALARKERTLTNQWNGVTSAGVTSQWQDEATEAVDNSPTLGRVTINMHKLTIFVPYSIEVQMDWPQMESVLRGQIAREKANKEAVAHATGLGDGSDQPFGVLTSLSGGVNEVNSAGAGAVAAADLFALDNALNQRYRQAAQWVADRPTYNAVRQLGVSDGMALWTRLPGPNPDQLIGYTANEASAFPAVAATNTPLVLGDWQEGYIVCDRVGMVVENIPHLFGPTNRFPTGERGIYCYLRTGADVVNENAFASLLIG